MLNVKTASSPRRLPIELDRDLYIGLVLSVLALALYLKTMPPTVLEGDSAEFQHMAYYLGVPHSSGYPLYLFLAKLFTYIPLGNVAFRVNLLSVVCAALTVPFVYWTARRITIGPMAAIAATALFAVTPSMWGGALQAKTYALHLLLGVLCVWFALRWHQEGKSQDLYGMCLAFGLGLVNHHVIVLLSPGLGYVIWLGRHRLNRMLVIRALALVLIPLLMYLYLPIRAGQLIAAQDPENWKLYTREDAILKGEISSYYRHTLDGFLNLVTGFDNSYKLRSPLEDDRVRLVLTLLWQQFGPIGIAAAFLGAIESFKRERHNFVLILLVAIGIGAIATILRGLSAVYYFSLTYFAIALWFGVALDWLFQRGRRYARPGVFAVGLGAAALVMAGLFGNYATLDKSESYGAEKDAQTVLNDRLETNAVVIAPWEVSEPIHYFQFVENQRPDLLVTNVSPVTKQFETMMKNAHALGRPFYLTQFEPELPSTSGVRTVKAIPLPLTTAPQPRHLFENAHAAPQVQVLGYDISPDPPDPGRPFKLYLYYRAAERMYPMYSAKLALSDVTGRPWVEAEGFPVSLYFPTYRWYELGEYYRDEWSVNVPAEAPAGLYNLDMTWYVYDLESHKPDYDHPIQIPLGIVRVGTSSNTNISQRLAARLGEGIQFLGWNSEPRAVNSTVGVSRGDSINLDLFWQQTAAIPTKYTVLVHLVEPSGRVLADADSPPLGGMLPTDAWITKEIIKDRHVLTVPADIPPGQYGVEIGMYDSKTGERLPVVGETESANYLRILKIQVK